MSSGKPRQRMSSVAEAGAAALLNGRVAEAAALFAEAVEAEPQNARVRANYGAALQMMGRFDDAAASHRRSIELEPGVALYHYNLGVALGAARKYDAAEETYRRAVALDPSMAVAHGNLGTVLQATGREHEAERHLRRAARLDPESAWALCNLGAVLYSLERYLESARVYRRSAEMHPSAEAFCGQGMALQAQGDLDAALELFEAAVRLDPNHAAAAFRLGRLLVDRNEHERAEACYRRSLELDPSVATVWIALGALLESRQESDESEEMFRKALELEPGSDLAHFNLGVVFERRDELEEAAEEYRRVLALEPEHFSALQNLAGVLWRLGEHDEGRATYQKLRELYPDDPTAQHLAAATAGEHTDTAPREYVTELFDDYARRYDEHMLETLQYRAASSLAGAVSEVLGERRARHTLDLGCGTGLVGAQLRDLTDVLEGVDLSPSMLERAGALGIYDALFEAELVEFLARDRGPYDLMTAADVVIYVGNLVELFFAARARMPPGGLLAFSTELASESEAFCLRDNGRFGHGQAYIEGLARAHQLEVALRRDTTLRTELDEPVAGQLWILRA